MEGWRITSPWLRAGIPAAVRVAALVLAATASAAKPEPAAAQEPDVAIAMPVGGLRESYDETAAVSGGVVVGIRLGEPAGKVSVDNIRFAANQPSVVCVRAMTKDGRFSSSNTYDITGKPGRQGVLLRPATDAYKTQLSGYDGRDYALNVFEARQGQCILDEALHFPQLLAGKTPDTLTLLINARSRSVTLTAPGGATDIRCGAPEGARIAFDQQCSVNISGLAEGPAEFTISMDDGFDTEEETVKVALPLR